MGLRGDIPEPVWDALEQALGPAGFTVRPWRQRWASLSLLERQAFIHFLEVVDAVHRIESGMREAEALQRVDALHPHHLRVLAAHASRAIASLAAVHDGMAAALDAEAVAKSLVRK